MKHYYLTFNLFVLIFFISSASFSQTFNTYYGDVVSNVSQTNITNDLITFENFGIKNVGSTRLTNAQNWITTRYSNLGYTNIELQEFTYSSGTSNNIIVTKTGTTYPNTFIIIDAHYDTINGPGTNDNGSGTVLIMELARLLANVPTEYSIKFIHFSGEEDGLVGSNYYVDNTVIPQNLDIKLVFNIDEVGGVDGMVNNTIVCERDQSNSPTTNNAASNIVTGQLATCIELYSNLNTEISYAYASDYMPFEDNNEVITGLYESNETPYAHGPNDLLVNMDPSYLYEVTKGSLGAAMFFAEVDFNVLNTESYSLESNISMYPNPTRGQVNIAINTALNVPTRFMVYDILGKQVFQKSISKQQASINLNHLKDGVYLAVFENGDKRTSKKLIIK
ncbi:M28 family peptidase [Xanthomarina spongicola]|uniref:Putative secreted protein (Por secretion system target) n=1 Tax=Xanthomarina spongicola TaxID=570520 RepID=A0A316DNF4_9FLAO|nr:M28 family peptidase [Xanthomarina spongicola]PWK19296.1 putative secreted protein (Por secretion system target) [Xanthomarina spongicola]